VLDWIKKKFDLTVISGGTNDEEVIPIEETDFYREMNKNRVGNLLEAARIRAGLKQKDLAQKVGVKQNMISDYERGRRRLTPQMAQRLAGALNMPADRFD
jgi:ribosome-binding protein aMBF1 (putative translation factor)